MDNASIHHTAEVRNLAWDYNWTLIFLPPYSPEFNPIEKEFAVFKA
jgi:transposase